MSLVLGKVGQRTGKGPILIMGSFFFMALAGMWLISPGLDRGWLFLIASYSFMGVGRATFESTLRATFADFFAKDSDGAFANIILQSGLSSALAFFLFPRLTCSTASDYCVEYQDGNLHNVKTLELIVVGVSAAAVLGYLRAAQIFRGEQRKEEEAKNLYGENAMGAKV
jgi:MFS family permease